MNYPIVSGSDILPARDCQRLRTERSPSICFAGDSTMLALGNDNVSDLTTTPAQIMSRLRRANPNKQFTVYNRAIGGSTMRMLGGLAPVPEASRPAWWQGADGTAWPSLIASLNCTQVYIGSGANDGAHVDALALRALVAALLSVDNPPDIFLITTRIPGASFIAQEARACWLYPASLFRHFSLSGGAGMDLPATARVGLIDIGRWQAINVTGVDFANQYLSDIVTPVEPLDIKFTAETEAVYSYIHPTPFGGDFYLDISFPDQAGMLWNNGRSVLVFNIGVGTAELKLASGEGRVYFQLYATSGAKNIEGGSMLIPEAGDLHITLSVQGAQVLFRCNGLLFYDTMVPRMSAPMSLRITAFHTGYVPFATINRFSGGVPLAYHATMTSDCYFGTNCMPSVGGGADVHPATTGYALDQIFLDAQDFSAAPAPPAAALATEDLEVSLAGPSLYFIDPTGKDRKVTLPRITPSNMGVDFTIRHGGQANLITVRDIDGLAVEAQLFPGQTAKFTCNHDGSWLIGE